MHAATVQTGNDMLERDLKAMKDNYDKICSENRQLNALFTRQHKDKEKRRERDEALKEARDNMLWLLWLHVFTRLSPYQFSH